MRPIALHRRSQLAKNFATLAPSTTDQIFTQAIHSLPCNSRPHPQSVAEPSFNIRRMMYIFYVLEKDWIRVHRPFLAIRVSCN